MNVARFIAFCGKQEYGRSRCIFAYISMTTRAGHFKFAVTPVQRLQLAMVALTQKSFSAQYAWFSRGGSHIIMVKLWPVGMYMYHGNNNIIKLFIIQTHGALVATYQSNTHLSVQALF